MPWVRIDEEFPHHPKVVKAGPLGMAMQVAALCYCNRYLTDGFVPRSVAATLLDFTGLGMRMWMGELTGGGEDATWQLVVQDLEDAGLWERVEGGWRIHDYHDYQPSRDHILRLRETRKEVGRKGGLAKGKQVAKQPPSNDEATAEAKDEAKSYPGPVPVPPVGDPGVQVIPQAATDGVHPLADPKQPDRPGTLPTAAAIQEVWTAYLAARESAGLSTSVRLTPKRRDKIRTRLKAFPLTDVVDAAWGWTRDPWPERRHHCDAVQVFKTDEQVEKFRDLWRHGPPRVVSKQTAQAMRTSVAMRTRRQARAEAEEVNRDRGRVGRSGGPAERGLPAPAD
jgi:hypothetical protein